MIPQSTPLYVNVGGKVHFVVGWTGHDPVGFVPGESTTIRVITDTGRSPLFLTSTEAEAYTG